MPPPRERATLVSQRHPALARFLRALVAAIGLARRQIQLDGREVLVGELRQEMGDAIEPGALLVVGIDDEPRRLLAVGVLQHQILGARILDPVLARFEVHRAQLPALDRVAHALGEALFLLPVIHREPVLDQVDSRADQHLLELRASAEEFAILLVGAEAHHPLDPGAVVPAAVEQDHLAARRQMGDVALKVPLSALLLGRRAERHDAADARVEALADPLDDAALAAASRPSKITTTLRPCSRTHSCSLISSNCRRTSSSTYLYLAAGRFGGLPSPTMRQRCSMISASLA